MICLDRRVVLHWKHTMVHLLSDTKSKLYSGGQCETFLYNWFYNCSSSFISSELQNENYNISIVPVFMGMKLSPRLKERTCVENVDAVISQFPSYTVISFRSFLFKLKITQIKKIIHFLAYIFLWLWPPLWSSGQSSWLQIQSSEFDFPALSDFLRISGSGTGSTQPREYNWAATCKEK
jgi:hypothetical protein